MNIAVLADLHGNWQAALNKLRKIGAIYFPGDDVESHASTLVAPSLYEIEKNDDWYVIQVGDFLNMGVFPSYHPLYMWRNDLQMAKYYTLFDKILLGNHEAFYTHNLDTGRFWGMATSFDQLEPGTMEFIKEMMGTDHYVAATVAIAADEPWLITHAGLHPAFNPRSLAEEYWEGKGDLSEDDLYLGVANQLNSDLWNLVYRTKDYAPHITRVGQDSGGQGHGGILWLRPQECASKYYHNPDNYTVLRQIVGHTPRSEHPRYVHLRKTWYIDNDNAGCIVSKDGGPWQMQ